jgi:ATP-dependent Clp protease ATP-binding subunit ClpA
LPARPQRPCHDRMLLQLACVGNGAGATWPSPQTRCIVFSRAPQYGWRRAAQSMFERFTDKARRVVILAQEDARLLSHNYIGAEHILLGLIQEGTGLAAQALESMGITHEAARQQVEEIVGRGQRQPTGHIPFTPQAKKALQLSLREAIHLGDNYIGTEHILLGLLREGDGPAIQVLEHLGVDPSQARRQVTDLARRKRSEDEPPTARAAGRFGRAGGKRQMLVDILAHLDSVESRLAALEHRVGAGPDVRDLDQEVAQIRLEKESAIDAQDFETAAMLRDRERQLLQERASRRQEWAIAHRDVPSLTDEIERLRAMLRQLGIEPRDGAA